MIFTTIYDFFAQVLGAAQMATDLGVLYATYGTYVIITLGLVALFRIGCGILRMFRFGG